MTIWTIENKLSDLILDQKISEVLMQKLNSASHQLDRAML